MSINNDRRYNQTDDPFIIDDLRQMENAPNYNNWLYSIVEPFIGKRVLEVGAGIGNISKRLIDNVDLLVGIEPNPYCSDVLARLFSNILHFLLITKTIEECKFDELKDYHFDTILCINVLEHIEDDAAILSLFGKILEPNGRVVLLVPAIPQAYGPIDRAVGHFRRYTKTSLIKILDKSNLRIERMFYSNFLGLLGWMYNNHIKQAVHQEDSQIRLFNQLVPIISFVESKIGCPIGQSLISISRVNK